MSVRPSVIVIGGGVVGLSTAITLLDAGLAVEIWAKDEAPPASTAATAVWHLFLVEDSRRTNEWAQFSKATLESFSRLPWSGILSRDGIELIRSSTPVVPQLLKADPSFRWLDRAELAPWPKAQYGYGISAPVADMSIHLPWLIAVFTHRGGLFRNRTAASLDDPALRGFDLVINCAGLAAGALAGDREVHPIKGQTLVLKPRSQPLELERYVGDDDHPEGSLYFVPRFTDVVVGGTTDPDASDLTADQATTTRLLRDVLDLAPELADFQHVQTIVGLRPYRATVRVETDLDHPQPVVHNYGHGGSGYTLSWGCARAVLDLVRELGVLPLESG